MTRIRKISRRLAVIPRYIFDISISNVLKLFNFIQANIDHVLTTSDNDMTTIS